MRDVALRDWRESLKRWPLLRRLRLIHLEIRNRFFGLPHWQVLRSPGASEWIKASAAASKPKVLVASSVGAHMAANTLDSLLAVALTLRGARVQGLLCDRALPACVACEVSWWPDHEHFAAYGPERTLCGPCFRPANSMWSRLGLEMQLIGRYASAAERDWAWSLSQRVAENEIDKFEYAGVRVGMHARATALRYFAIGNFEHEPDALTVRRRFLAAALFATTALDRLFTQERYDVCVAHHGVYIPQGVLVDLARKHGTRIVTWNIAYRSGSFIFSHDDTYHFTLMQEPTKVWDALPWNPRLQQALDNYMISRAVGSQDWVSYHDGSGQSVSELSSKFGIDFTRPTITAFTNVSWDAQIFYPSQAFPTMLGWLVETVGYFASRPDLQLVIRVHPAEVLNPLKSRERVVDQLANIFPELPSNVFVIPPTESANSYAMARASNAAIIYGTKMGVELAYMGIPTIVAGESWARNKGLTLDANNRNEYFALLDRLPFEQALDEPTKLRASRFAFHFFFRRMVPLDFLTPRKGSWPPFELKVGSLDILKPGRSAGLDVICDGILRNAPFIYPAEEVIAQRYTSAQ